MITAAGHEQADQADDRPDRPNDERAHLDGRRDRRRNQRLRVEIGVISHSSSKLSYFCGFFGSPGKFGWSFGSGFGAASSGVSAVGAFRLPACGMRLVDSAPTFANSSFGP